MVNVPLDCPCKAASAVDWEHLLEGLRALRNRCSALEQILIPDWEAFEQADRKLEGNRATHRSMLLLALERGHISRITFPIHLYLMESEQPKKELTKQYRKDLQERWFMEDDELKRHKKSRTYLGRLVELQCAQWIEEQNWRVQNLEALGGTFDIEAFSPRGDAWAIEVKYIGQEDWDFVDISESVDRNGVGKGRAVSLYAPSDWVLFKIYEAANQLADFPQARLAVLVISDLTWHHFQIPLKENWMHWESPRFFNNDSSWNIFFQKQKKRYPNIEREIGTVLGSLTQAWIIREQYGYQYAREYEIPFTDCES